MSTKIPTAFHHIQVAYKSRLKIIPQVMGAQNTFKGGMEDCLKMLKAEAEGFSWYLTSEAEAFLDLTDFNIESLRGTKLPYDNMTIEFENPIEMPGGELVNLAISFARDPIGEPDRVNMHQYRKGYKEREWAMFPAVARFSLEALLRLDEWVEFDTKDNKFRVVFNADKRTENGQLLGLSIFNPAAVLGEIWNGGDSGEAIKKAYETGNTTYYDRYDEIAFTTGFLKFLKLLVVLNCGNAPISKLKVSPQLNKKWRKKTTAEIPSFSILNINAETSYNNKKGKTGVSPKTHWRRGHIHSYHTKKGLEKRWIKPHIVAAKHGDTPTKLKVVKAAHSGKG